MMLCDGPRNNKHEEVCYEAGVCPVCEKLNEIGELVAKIEALKDRIIELEPDLRG